MIFGLILAGGEGRRLGGADKALLDLAGRPLLAHVAARIAPQVAGLALSANGDPERFKDFGLPVLADGFGDARKGPLAGIAAGLDWAAAGGAVALVTVAVDTPFLPQDLVARLMAASGGARPALASSGGRVHPTIALWPIAARPAVAAALAADRLRLLELLRGLDPVEVAFDADPDPFANINTTADLAAAEARAAGQAR